MGPSAKGEREHRRTRAGTTARTQSDSRWHDVEQDREVVGNAAGEDEDVPGGVEVAAMVECEEDDAEGIGHAAAGEPE